MPRVARIYTEEGVFHILAKGNNIEIEAVSGNG